jgi:hypothetical protein
MMTIVMFGGKSQLEVYLWMYFKACKPKNTHPNSEVRRWQHHVVGCFAAGGTGALQNRWHYEEGKLYGYIEARSEDISQEVKAWSQMGLPNGQ